MPGSNGYMELQSTHEEDVGLSSSPSRRKSHSRSQIGGGDRENANADVAFKEDIFHSVLVAAFGGVKANLEKDESMMVHPLFMFVFCIPLFMIQMSVITFLRLDMDLTDHFIKYEEGHHWHVEGNLVLTAKLLMMLVVQLLLFEDIRSVLQLLVFALNPTSWSDIKRPDPDEMRLKSGISMVWRPWFLAPWAIGALIMKVIVAYFVCVDSVSIILATETVKKAIFEALAMVFVVELASVWFVCASSAFHLDPFKDFKFLIASDDFKRKMSERATIKIPQWLNILHRGNGARKLEIVITYTIIFFIYSRQLNVVVYALHTNVLPVARDVYTLWRYQVGKAEYLKRVQVVIKVAMRYMLVYDPSEDIVERCDPDQDAPGYCDEQFERMRTSDVKEMWARYPGMMLGGTIAILVFFIVPQVVYVLSKWIKQIISVHTDEEKREEEEEEVSMDKVWLEMQQLKTEIGQYKQDKGLS